MLITRRIFHTDNEVHRVVLLPSEG